MKNAENINGCDNTIPQFVELVFLILGVGISFALISNESSENLKTLLELAAHYGIRITMIGLAIGAWFKTQSIIENRKNNKNEINDLLHNISTPVNNYFHRNPKAANSLLITSSAFIDVFGIFILLISIFGDSIRPFASLLILFGLRQAFQIICALPKPHGLIWRDPGFPSLLVTYDVENDFYFSGHTSIAILATIELYMINPWLGFVAGIIALFEIATVIVLRAHYTMDIFTAILAAFCVTAMVALIL